jgi:hypothetical protein
LEVEIKEEELRKIKDCFGVSLRFKETNLIVWRFIMEQVSLDEMHSKLIPYIFAETIRKE